MNSTNYNFTDPILSSSGEMEDSGGDLVRGIVDLDSLEEEDTHDLGFSFETSLLKIFPKFLRAIVTLLISGLLLGMTFLLITIWKRGCRTHRKLEEDKPNGKVGSDEEDSRSGTPLHSIIVSPPEEDEDEEYTIDSSTIQPTNSSFKPIDKNSKHIKIPKQTLLRRASGPFGSEALSFVQEQYTMKNMEKERHHFVEGHGHHGRHSPQNPHPQRPSSRASNAGDAPETGESNKAKLVKFFKKGGGASSSANEP